MSLRSCLKSPFTRNAFVDFKRLIASRTNLRSPKMLGKSSIQGLFKQLLSKREFAVQRDREAPATRSSGRTTACVTSYATSFVRSHAALIFAKWAGEVEWR
jgi:hypothetical protein